MNCQKLHSDIERLKSLRDELSSKLEASTESGLGKIALSNLSHEASNTADEILEHYIEDIIEQNINDKESKNSEFLNSVLEQYIEQGESEDNSESLITPDTTVDQVRNNLSEYLKSDKKLDSNLLVYVLKERLNLFGDNSTNGQNFNLKELEELCKDFLPDKALPRLAYLHKIAERLRNLEVLETKNYIFMLPKDKWNEDRIRLPEGDNQNELDPKFIAPSDLTAILKQPVDYDYSYETDGQRTDSPSIVYDKKWIGKEIRHFPWTKELLKTNEEFLKPNGFHIPTKENWKQIYDNLKAKYGDDRAISTALREDLNLAFSGYVWGGNLERAGSSGYFWSSSERSADFARCLYFHSGLVGPENWNVRNFANSVRCVSESGSFPNS